VIVWPCWLDVSTYAARGREIDPPRVSCPHCGGPTGRWSGYLRHLRDAELLRIFVPRVRCRRCGATAALLPWFVAPYRWDTVDVIGQALERSAAGEGVRRIAAALARPETTVREWCRRFGQVAADLARILLAAAVRAGWTGFDLPTAPRPRATVAAGALASAWTRRHGPASSWRLAALVTGGAWLAPNTTSPLEAALGARLRVAAWPGGRIDREHRRPAGRPVGNEDPAEPLGIDRPAGERLVQAPVTPPEHGLEAQRRHRADRRRSIERRVAELEQGVAPATETAIERSPEPDQRRARRAAPHTLAALAHLRLLGAVDGHTVCYCMTLRDGVSAILREEMSMPRPSAADRAMEERIVADLGSVGFALPGTVLERRVRCGKEGCRCRADPPQLHGPYFQWTRKVAGKTETRLLSAAQMARYRDWFENAKRLRALTSELEALSLDIAESAEDWG